MIFNVTLCIRTVLCANAVQALAFTICKRIRERMRRFVLCAGDIDDGVLVQLELHCRSPTGQPQVHHSSQLITAAKALSADELITAENETARDKALRVAVQSRQTVETGFEPYRSQDAGRRGDTALVYICHKIAGKPARSCGFPGTPEGA